MTPNPKPEPPAPGDKPIAVLRFDQIALEVIEERKGTAGVMSRTHRHN